MVRKQSLLLILSGKVDVKCCCLQEISEKHTNFATLCLQDRRNSLACIVMFFRSEGFHLSKLKELVHV